MVLDKAPRLACPHAWSCCWSCSTVWTALLTGLPLLTPAKLATTTSKQICTLTTMQTISMTLFPGFHPPLLPKTLSIAYNMMPNAGNDCSTHPGEVSISISAFTISSNGSLMRQAALPFVLITWTSRVASLPAPPSAPPTSKNVPSAKAMSPSVPGSPCYSTLHIILPSSDEKSATSVLFSPALINPNTIPGLHTMQFSSPESPTLSW